ncbi:unnamed protein product, partial [Prorocentrum cordatum]
MPGAAPGAAAAKPQAPDRLVATLRPRSARAPCSSAGRHSGDYVGRPSLGGALDQPWGEAASPPRRTRPVAPAPWQRSEKPAATPRFEPSMGLLKGGWHVKAPPAGEELLRDPILHHTHVVVRRLDGAVALCRSGWEK